MKILLAHNDYGKYSGEEAVVDKMAAMLPELGYEVAQLRMSTANYRESISGKVKGFLSGLWSPAGVKAMRNAILNEKPNIVNVHNLYPFISPAALKECRKADIPVIMTIHNFRLMCPTGLFMRDGRPCELCLQEGNEWNCVKYNCEHSMFKSVGYALRNAVARINHHYINCVDVFACITDFQRRKLVEAGFDPDKIVVIPNSMESPELLPEQIEGSYIGFSGRISREKGVDIIINVARRHPEIPFKLAGVVREPNLVEHLPANVELTGYLQGDDLDNFYRNASFFVMASRWYEGFPMTILDAAKYGKALVAPDHGGFTEIIGSGNDAIGVLFEPNNEISFEEAVVSLWNKPELIRILGQKANRKLYKEYSTHVIAQKWKILIDRLATTH